MKNLLPRISIYLTAIFFLCSPVIVRADGSCANMKISHIGTNPVAPSGVEVWLQNLTGAACGSIAANEVAQFYLSATNTDRTLAVVLTAITLKKNVWVYYTGTAAPYIPAFLSVLYVTD